MLAAEPPWVRPIILILGLIVVVVVSLGWDFWNEIGSKEEYGALQAASISFAESRFSQQSRLVFSQSQNRRVVAILSDNQKERAWVLLAARYSPPVKILGGDSIQFRLSQDELNRILDRPGVSAEVARELIKHRR